MRHGTTSLFAALNVASLFEQGNSLLQQATR
jgi:hypothetical protein